jgi:asparagine synthase (glutamine-hydrolysing)
LSGGIDSSGLLACAVARGPAPGIEAFCFAAGSQGLPPGADEWPWAEQAARATGTRLHRVELAADEVPALLSRVVTAQDFPFGSPVVLAQARLFAAMAERGCDAVLGGHGPEVLFGGGMAHAALRAAELVRSGHPGQALALLEGAAGYLSARKRHLAGATLRALLRVAPPAEPAPGPAHWARTRWFRERARMPERRGAATGAPALIDEQLSDSLGATSLLHEERNAAACGLDSRQPYLAAPIIEFARALPLAHAIPASGRTKHVLRLALAGLVPDPILARRERQGFPVPAAHWLLANREWASRRYAELRSLPFFDGPAPERAWAELGSPGGRGWAAALRMWRWIVLLEWARARNARFE